jgi:hypothetical protein
LIILIILGKEYKLWSSSLCSSLQPPVNSSLFGPNIQYSTAGLKLLNALKEFNCAEYTISVREQGPGENIWTYDGGNSKNNKVSK